MTKAAACGFAASVGESLSAARERYEDKREDWVQDELV